MPNGPLRIGWSAVTERFRNLDTGRFISGASAAPWLKVSDGALRDSLGRYVPWSYAGGEVSREFPTGRGDMIAITRGVPMDVSDMPVRPQDMLQDKVIYSVAGVTQEMAYVGMPKGRGYTSVVAEERMAVSITGQLRYRTGEEVEWNEITVEFEEWNLTTFYHAGQYLAADYSYFEGM